MSARFLPKRFLLATDFFKKMIDDLDDSVTAIAADNKASADAGAGVFINTGSYILNAALSGSMFGGLPDNRVLVMSGETSVGKTFFALSIIKSFLDEFPDGRVVYYDTESAVTNDMLGQRGIDLNRVAKSEPQSLEQFRTSALKLLDAYGNLSEDKRFKLLVVLDSLSALPSNKEITDISEGKDTKDMTKAPLIKGAFRVLRLKMAKLGVSMIVTTHTYAVVGAYVPTREMAGGSGAKYAADTIIFLTKTKERDDEKSVIGNVITATLYKSRYTKEGSRIKTRILFDGGLDRYYGLLEHAVAAGLVKKGTKYEFPNGEKAFEKSILKNPEKYFTDDLLKALEDYVKVAFSYTSTPAVEESDNDGE